MARKAKAPKVQTVWVVSCPSFRVEYRTETKARQAADRINAVGGCPHPHVVTRNDRLPWVDPLAR